MSFADDTRDAPFERYLSAEQLERLRQLNWRLAEREPGTAEPVTKPNLKQEIQ